MHRGPLVSTALTGRISATFLVEKPCAGGAAPEVSPPNLRGPRVTGARQRFLVSPRRKRSLRSSPAAPLDLVCGSREAPVRGFPDPVRQSLVTEKRDAPSGGGENAQPADRLADGPRRAQTVLALPEPDRSSSMRLAMVRARMRERCGTARGEALGGHVRG